MPSEEAQVQPSSITTPINVYDAGSVKQKLDKAIECTLSERGHSEDFTASNIKIVTGLIACACAIVAYFKTDHLVISTLCAIYMVLGFISQYMPSLLEKKTVYVSKSPKPIRVESELKLQNEIVPVYTVSVVRLPDGLGFLQRYRFVDQKVTSSRSWPINQLLDEEGTVDLNKFKSEIMQVVDQLHAKKQ